MEQIDFIGCILKYPFRSPLTSDALRPWLGAPQAMASLVSQAQGCKDRPVKTEQLELRGLEHWLARALDSEEREQERASWYIYLFCDVFTANMTRNSLGKHECGTLTRSTVGVAIGGEDTGCIRHGSTESLLVTLDPSSASCRAVM